MKYTTLTSVFVTADFVGFHRWPTAPDRRAYLRELHRHLFKVHLEISVSHDNREIEYHDLKEGLENWILSLTAPRHDFMVWSCERMATNFLDWARQEYPDREYYQAEVSEDGENGSIAEAWTAEER